MIESSRFRWKVESDELMRLAVEVNMVRTWAVSLGENERMELERAVMDEDREAALVFLKKVVYPKVKESEKPGSCFHHVETPVDDVGRPVKKHKGIGSFD